MTLAGDDSVDFPALEAAQLRRDHLPEFEWSHYDTPSPRNRLRVPLGAACIGLVSTAGAHPAGTPGLGTHGRAIRLPLDAEVQLTHAGYDTEVVIGDPEVVLPRRALLDLVASGRIGAVAATVLSTMGGALRASRIIERAAPATVDWARAEAVDLAVLVPACPVCQQSVALLQRALDDAGVATVSITQVPGITELIKPSLACFVAHPFGRVLGPLHDAPTHRAVLEAVLAEAERDWPAGTIVPLPFRWTLDDLRDRQLGRVPG